MTDQVGIMVEAGQATLVKIADAPRLTALGSEGGCRVVAWALGESLDR